MVKKTFSIKSPGVVEVKIEETQEQDLALLKSGIQSRINDLENGRNSYVDAMNAQISKLQEELDSLNALE